ncbi:SDR family NAD(P)-dependent oxidoreductase [Microbacterium sp. MPKO10]|uniref:SDR family NAD(P)-dependent oxidoreductase n=1 Tax=Microbacterium sp. MPKO10 TaxID=2989818 RepID=UPI002236450B|nr:SDR family oxidoreductase [Microbacterium sp. MPKO10]MCW4459855.1 SDR family oxidoreductase [Microbacterium sp. MPKO10]
MRSDLFDLNGFHALVTGGGEGGLGAAMAISLARAGADVAVLELESGIERADHTAARVADHGVESLALSGDVADSASVDHAVSTVEERWGHIDILVNAAGIMLRKPSIDTAISEWQRIIDVNLTGTWMVSNRVAPKMLERGYGRIINVASQYAQLAGPLPEPAYYASKGGVANLTRGLASEWGTQGVTVNCIAPGTFYPTAMTRPLADDPDRLEWMRSRTLLHRLGDPATDLSGPTVFLASEASAYVTGALVPVDGGWTSW